MFFCFSSCSWWPWTGRVGHRLSIWWASDVFRQECWTIKMHLRWNQALLLFYSFLSQHAAMYYLYLLLTNAPSNHRRCVNYLFWRVCWVYWGIAGHSESGRVPSCSRNKSRPFSWRLVCPIHSQLPAAPSTDLFHSFFFPQAIFEAS